MKATGGTQASVAAGDWGRWLNRLGPLLALLLVFALFAAICPPSFRSIWNLETIARQTTIVGIAALGMTLVIVSGGIDLSVGSLVALSTVVIAWSLGRAGLVLDPWAAAGLAIAACAWWPYVWSLQTPVRVGDDGKVPVGPLRLTIAAPPRSTVIRCQRPNGDISYLRYSPDPNSLPVLLLHCPVL
jgi:hypothetical protein